MFNMIFLILELALALIMYNIIYKGSNKFKKGFLVLAKIKSIKLINMENNGALQEMYEIICEFEYEGHHELEIYYSKKEFPNLSVADTIECVYDPNVDVIITKKKYSQMQKIKFIVLILIIADIISIFI